MKKIITAIVIANLASFSIVAMDDMTVQFQVTQEQNKAFCSHLRMATASAKKMIQDGEISQVNSISYVLNRMEGILADSNGDVSTMIAKMELADHINLYKQLDSNPLIQFGLNQVRSQSGDVKAAVDYVRKTRSLLSGLLLQQKQPSYSPSFIGEVQAKDRVEFMKRNESYFLSDTDSIKGYAALFVYQLVFTSQVD